MATVITPLLYLLLAQAPAVSQVQICDKSVSPARCAPVTTAAPAASDPGINVRVVSQPAGGGGAAFSVVDEAAWTAGSSAMVPAGGVFNDSATALTSGQQGQVRLTGNRGIHANLRTAAGVEFGTAGAPLRTDPTGTTPEPVTQSGTWSMLQSGAWSVSLLAGSNVIGGVTQSGTWTVTGAGGTFPVTGTFWQATQPISAASLPLPSGASTEATLASIKAKTDNLDVLLSTRTKPADTQTVSGTVTTSPPSNASTNLTQFGGSSVVTGTGTSGAGVPRVTVSSDSFPTGAAQETGGNLATIATSGATSANQSTGITNQTNGSQRTGLVAGSAAIGTTYHVEPSGLNATESIRRSLEKQNLLLRVLVLELEAMRGPASSAPIEGLAEALAP